MLAVAWAGGPTADNNRVETQTPHSLSLQTRDEARVVLARAFEEAAVMPGTLLPHELLSDLTEMAGQIVHEVASLDDDALLTANGRGAWAYMVDHSIDATVVGLLVGRRVVPDAELTELGVGLFLQDIGKLALPPRLAHMEGPLAPDERALMMRHPLLGLEFLRDDAVSPPSKSVVRSHHERWDGSGYPDALAGDEIPVFARIAAVADVFDAVTSERFHAHAVPVEEGVDLIRRSSGTAFDPAVVEAFLDVAGSAASR
jgi:HD-GYP domain-containing protein (c-di-GMP phosphodiesterase class II)